MASDHPIPAALVHQAAAAMTKHWETVPYVGQVAYEDAEAVLSAVPSLHGPGPNGEWGRWEIVGFMVEDKLFGQLPPKELRQKPREHVYRFVPLPATMRRAGGMRSLGLSREGKPVIRVKCTYCGRDIGWWLLKDVRWFCQWCRKEVRILEIER